MKGFSELKPIFAARFHDIMVARNMGVVEVAKRVRINRRTAYRYVNPCLPDLPRIDTLLALAEVLRCDPNYLLGKEETR